METAPKIAVSTDVGGKEWCVQDVSSRLRRALKGLLLYSRPSCVTGLHCMSVCLSVCLSVTAAAPYRYHHFVTSSWPARLPRRQCFELSLYDVVRMLVRVSGAPSHPPSSLVVFSPLPSPPLPSHPPSSLVVYYTSLPSPPLPSLPPSNSLIGALSAVSPFTVFISRASICT